MCELLMAGGVHHQFAVRVTLQALKIEAARRLFRRVAARTRRRGARCFPESQQAAPADRRWQTPGYLAGRRTSCCWSLPKAKGFRLTSFQKPISPSSSRIVLV